MRLLFLLFSFNLYGGYKQTETIKEYIYDFSVSGQISTTSLDISTATTGTQLLPSTAAVKEVNLRVLTPLTSSVNSSITIGNTTSNAGYFQAIPVSSFTDNALMVGNGSLIWDDTNDINKMFLADDTADRNLTLTVSAGTSVSAGKILFMVKYYTFGRED